MEEHFGDFFSFPGLYRVCKEVTFKKYCDFLNKHGIPSTFNEMLDSNNIHNFCKEDGSLYYKRNIEAYIEEKCNELRKELLAQVTDNFRNLDIDTIIKLTKKA